MKKLAGVELLIEVAQHNNDLGILVFILYDNENGINFADIRRELKQRRRKLSGVVLKEKEVRKLVKDAVTLELASQYGDRYKLLENIRRLIELQRKYMERTAS